MGIKFTFCLLSAIAVISVAIGANAQVVSPERRPVPQLPVSILDEILKNTSNQGIDNNSNNQINSILALFPGPNSDNAGNGVDDSTGIAVLDFFRNLIATFLRTFLQVFRFFQLLARTITGTDPKKVAFLSSEQTISDISGKQSADINRSEPKLENVLRQIQRSAEQYPINMLISDQRILQMERQINEALKSLPTLDDKSLNQILKTGLITDNLLTDMTSGRHKRQTEDNNEYIGNDISFLLNQFYKSHSQLNNDFNFEFPRFD